MIRRRLFIAISMLVWLVALALGAKVALDRVQVPPWGNPAQGTESIELTGGTRVGQQFTAPWPGLYRIEVELDRGTAAADQEITFHLKERAGPVDGYPQGGRD